MCVQPRYMVASRQCAQCERPTQFHCSRCQLIFYCSRECQKAHWPVHLLECQALEPCGLPADVFLRLDYAKRNRGDPRVRGILNELIVHCMNCLYGEEATQQMCTSLEFEGFRQVFREPTLKKQEYVRADLRFRLKTEDVLSFTEQLVCVTSIFEYPLHIFELVRLLDILVSPQKLGEDKRFRLCEIVYLNHWQIEPLVTELRELPNLLKTDKYPVFKEDICDALGQKFGEFLEQLEASQDFRVLYSSAWAFMQAMASKQPAGKLGLKKLFDFFQGDQAALLKAALEKKTPLASLRALAPQVDQLAHEVDLLKKMDASLVATSSVSVVQRFEDYLKAPTHEMDLQELVNAAFFLIKLIL